MECSLCGRESVLISKALGICVDCIRSNFARSLPYIERAHNISRTKFLLPAKIPREERGAKCQTCANECEIREREFGYCGLRTNFMGKLVLLVTEDRGYLSWYYDDLPTNCVANWVCGERRSCGYKNLAVFYHGCSFDCLFCQNWHYKVDVKKIIDEVRCSASEEDVRVCIRNFSDPTDLANAVDEKTNCVCYFGGDPTPHIQHALRTSHLALARKEVRICWETNGSMNPKFLKEMAELSLDSGGCIKFDLKAFSEEVHIALCGVSNKRTLENFSLLASYAKKRREPPFLIASTLLVPGYVDKVEVGNIARFIAQVDPETPYTLLGFHPQFCMDDLPTTSFGHALECVEEARRAGLKRLRIGNIHLLGNDY